MSPTVPYHFCHCLSWKPVSKLCLLCPHSFCGGPQGTANLEEVLECAQKALEIKLCPSVSAFVTVTSMLLDGFWGLGHEPCQCPAASSEQGCGGFPWPPAPQGPEWGPSQHLHRAMPLWHLHLFSEKTEAMWNNLFHSKVTSDPPGCSTVPSLC